MKDIVDSKSWMRLSKVAENYKLNYKMSPMETS